MTKRTRRNHSPAFKAKVAIAAIKGDRTLAELSAQCDVHVNQITNWEGQLEGGAAIPPRTTGFGCSSIGKCHRRIEESL